MSVLRYRCECGRWVGDESDHGSVVCCPFCGSIRGEWVDIKAEEAKRGQAQWQGPELSQAKGERRETMSFKRGDKVRWLSGPGRPKGILRRGPYFIKARTTLWGQYSPQDWGPAWVVDFEGQYPPELIGETALESLEGWGPCPGDHRLVEGDVEPHWERRKT